MTTTRANFDNKYRCLDTVGGTSGLRAKVKPAQGLPKEYIFGHGTNLREESFVTTSQLAYEHKKKAEDTFRGLDSFQDPQERREVVRHSLVDKKRVCPSGYIHSFLEGNLWTTSIFFVFGEIGGEGEGGLCGVDERP